ncbi:MAG TPA: DUF885 domain-containing protein [Anaeromyxobacter sp.]|nr:DUF885 domain-containing protein [Anaeromyxobacter sp.]
MRLPRASAALAAAALAAGCAGVKKPAAGSDSERLAALLNEYWEDTLVLNPILATAIGDDRYDAELPNFYAPEYRARMKAHLERYLRALGALDRARLAGQDRLSHDVLRHDLESALEGLRFPDWLVPVHQFGSGPTFFAVLASGKGIQPFRTVKDYEAFLGRMDRLPPVFDQAIANMREGIRAGVVQPRPVMEKVLPQLDALAVDDPEKSAFWGAVASMPEAIPAAERERLAAAYRARISRVVLPAYRRLRDFVRDEYLPRCRDTAGYAALPDGKAWYAYLVKAATTTDLSPDRIHEIGLAEVARIRAEMERVKREVGFEGDLAAFFRWLRDDPRFYYTDPEALLAGYRALQEKVNAALPRGFDVFPKADYEIRPVEAFRAKSMSGAEYVQGTPDGRRPGVFYVNTHDLRAQPKFGMETLSLHEASPGHHFQISIAQEITDLPRFRRFGGYVAYQEGWALYAESIGKELGLFTDPLQWYGRLSDELLRAMRLVVDTGIHAKGWTREQAIRYMLDTSSMAESDVVSEVERYIAVPGQALGYKVGQLAITELRREAERELGARFDVKAFHRQVLVDGALPLEVLRTKIREWIAAQTVR